jgi:hypothetical protein
MRPLSDEEFRALVNGEDTPRLPPPPAPRPLRGALRWIPPPPIRPVIPPFAWPPMIDSSRTAWDASTNTKVSVQDAATSPVRWTEVAGDDYDTALDETVSTPPLSPASSDSSTPRMDDAAINAMLRHSSPGRAGHGFLGLPPIPRLPGLISHEWSPPPVPESDSMADFHPFDTPVVPVVRSVVFSNITTIFQRVVTPSSATPTFHDLLADDDCLIVE